MKEIDKIWIDNEAVYILTTDGRKARESFADYPRLRYATESERANFEVNAFGIHWPKLDEDLSFEGFFIHKSENKLYDFFMAHPELNASAIARRLGISQSLFAQYISGAKKPSKEREQAIFDEIHALGRELSSA